MRLRALAFILLAPFALLAGETITIGKSETAGICGYRALWDTPIITSPDGVRKATDGKIKDRGQTAPWNLKQRDNGAKPAAIAFDAIHRHLLVRFPGAAEQIAAKLKEGYTIKKVELVLPFKDEELWPEGSSNWVPPEGGYQYRANWGVDKLYRKERPTWHAVAWAVRKPWKADPKHGPTYNAYINGAGYWSRFGASSPEGDRIDQRFGPAPVNYKQPAGKMDITPVLTDKAFGDTVAMRLRHLADCGFVVRKWETYDHRYFGGVYEWATATGPRAIIIDQPKLIVTVEEGNAPELGELPPKTNIAALAETLQAQGGARPTAVMPSRKQLKQYVDTYAVRKPEWMPAWQWQRVQQMLKIQYGENAAAEPFWYQFVPGYIKGRYRGMNKKNPRRADGWIIGGLDPQDIYEAWVDQTLGQPYRGWHGFSASKELLPWFMYRDAMPAPCRQWFKDYWTAWLLPDRETSKDLFPPVAKQDGKMIHPMYDQLKKGSNTGAKIKGDSYYHKTGDWRGNKSFYRSGFNYTMSTTNFNNTASMGCLLGGAIINSKRALADGRHGQAHWPLRTWTWFDGSTQEEIDDYYFAITVKAQKMIMDFGPDVTDRLLGRSQLLKSMTMITDAYHPGLRRYIAGAARTAPHYRVCTQDGLYAVLNTLSRTGTFTDVGTKDTPEHFKSFGHELPMGQVAQQATRSPFAPQWFQHVIDEKPLPYETTATFKQWGAHVEHPIYRRTYLGRNFGLYSCTNGWGFLPAIAQWRRKAEVPKTSRELGTMFMRFGINDTRMVNDAHGWIVPYGNQAILQDGPRLIVSASANPYSNWINEKRKITSLQSTLAFCNYEKPAPTWKIHVDGKAVTALPKSVKAGQKITIHDGVTYIGIIPLPSADLGCTDDVVIRQGTRQTMQKSYHLQTALLIDNYALKQEAPLKKNADWKAVDTAHTGFVVEFGDVDQYGSFAAFQKHFHTTTLKTSFDKAKALHEIQYTSGKDLLEMGATTTWTEKTKINEAIPYQKVNGKSPYPAYDVNRESNFCMQAKTGKLEKNGATLRCTMGRIGFLLCDPVSKSVGGHNVLAELSNYQLKTPGGIEVAADGKVSLCFVDVEPEQKRIVINEAFLADQANEKDAANAMLLFGVPEGYTVHFNGNLVVTPETADINGRQALVVPFNGRMPADIARRYTDAMTALAPAQ